ncbi:DUF262 domain-containing protein [Mannheimia glucosida]|uniref:DUF262 domain-containing protein n=1 Tax=Mannheimia glucosida TaxID=85401 RepID=UPI003917D89F
MKFAAYPRNIRDILSLPRQHVIPRYQREYSWEKYEQVSEFWNDLLKQINFNETPIIVKDYFIGSLVLIGDDSRDTTFFVIDGQQRITTITILLSVLCEIGNEIYKKTSVEDYKAFSDLCYSFIEGTNNETFSKFFKLDNETPKPFFQKKILFIDKDKKIKPETIEEKRLNEAYDFFYEEIENNLLSKDFKNSQLEFLRAIFNQVMRFQTVYITVDNRENAQTIFETLNTKGKDLEPIDLIKNKIFEILSDEHPNDLAKEYWDKIKFNLNSREEQVNLSEFFYHFWISKYEAIPNHKIYDSFMNSAIEKNKDGITKFLRELLSASETYIQIISPQENDWKQQEEKKLLNSLKWLSIFSKINNLKIPRTFLLASLTKYKEKKVNVHDLSNSLHKVALFHLIFSAITSTRLSGLEKTYSKFARDIFSIKDRADARNVLDIVDERLKTKLKDISYPDFERKFIDIKYSNKITKDKRLIQLIFSIIEDEILKNTQELKVNLISLEHIYTQQKNTSWSHNIGNIIPLSKELNEECKDYSLKDKMPIFKNSELKQVLGFCEEFKYTDEWTEELTNKRAKNLANTIFTHVSNILNK